MHGEQAPPDQVGLHRLAHPQGDVGLAHADVELLVRQDEVELNIGIEFEEFGDTRRQPFRADAHRCRHAQQSVRPLAIVRQPHARRIELLPDILDRAKQDFALLGQDQAARMAVEQRHPEVLLQSADLSADGRLAQAQRLAGMGE